MAGEITRNDIRDTIQHNSSTEPATFSKALFVLKMSDMALSVRPSSSHVKSSFKRSLHVHKLYLINELLEGGILYGVKSRFGPHLVGQDDFHPDPCRTSRFLFKIVNPKILHFCSHGACADSNHLPIECLRILGKLTQRCVDRRHGIRGLGRSNSTTQEHEGRHAGQPKFRCGVGTLKQNQDSENVSLSNRSCNTKRSHLTGLEFDFVASWLKHAVTGK